MSSTTCLMSFNEPVRGGSAASARRRLGGISVEANAAAAALAVKPSIRRRVILLELKLVKLFVLESCIFPNYFVCGVSWITFFFSSFSSFGAITTWQYGALELLS